LKGKGVAAAWSDSVTDIADAVWNDARPGDLVLILSNGAFGGIYRMFREKAGEG
jgi:UDP-N-acetylmuramate-alanine ligase